MFDISSDSTAILPNFKVSITVKEAFACWLSTGVAKTVTTLSAPLRVVNRLPKNSGSGGGARRLQSAQAGGCRMLEFCSNSKS